MKNSLVSFLLFLGWTVCAQEHLPLKTLDGFKDQAGNWQIVGEVLVNRTIDVHQKSEVQPKNTSKKRKKKRKKTAEAPKPVTYIEGTGILLNMDDATRKDHLVTDWEHGDIILDMEVMLPKGSNSGIYLQGRYEVQLKDSWGIKYPKYSDIGGIYRNWEENPEVKFMGIPPSTNAAKAPGLWQKLHIHFQAPKFDGTGKKIANAKFVSVTLNGIPIHTNVEVPRFTGGPISKDEVAKGPLMIQGDHGPVAFRNISYQLLEDATIDLSSLTYEAYKGDFKGLEDMDGQPVLSKGTSEKIDVHVTGEEDAYGIVYSGTLNCDENDTYTFSVGYTGGVELLVDGKSIIKKNASDARGFLTETVTLSPGAHSLTLKNIKTAGWWPPRLGLYVHSATTNPKLFHTYESFPPSTNSVSPIFVDADAEPRMLRGFVSFEGDGERLPHTIGVGTPTNLNYIYDLDAGNLIGMWRGNFADATPMWHNRGDGSFRPRGAVQWTFLNQSIAELPKVDAPFPKTGTPPDFIPQGYSIDPNTRLPIFKHGYKGVVIEDKIIPDGNERHLLRELRFSKQGLINWYFKIASGKTQRLADGSYAIDGPQYYIKMRSNQIPTVRTVNGEAELVVPVDGSTIVYEIIW
ncbi:MAG: family 16 glycoside hydrolase [Flavobacteriaceae bacterium]